MLAEWLRRGAARLALLWAVLRIVWRWPSADGPALVGWLTRLRVGPSPLRAYTETVWDTAPQPATLAFYQDLHTTLHSPAYAAAQRAVRETRQTLAFRERTIGLAYKHMFDLNAGRRENVLRHVQAVALTRQYAGEDLSNADADILVALAYQASRVWDDRPRQVVEPRTRMAGSA